MRSPRWYWFTWLILCCYFVVGDAFVDTTAGFWRLLALNLVQNLNWGALGVLSIRLAHRLPVRSFRDWPRVVAQLAAAAGLALVAVTWAFLVLHVYYWLRQHPYPFTTFFYKTGELFVATTFADAWARYAVRWYHVNLFAMGVIPWLYQWHRLNEHLRETEVTAARMEADAQQAQNLALRSQLRPHFLFNALNAVSALVPVDPEGAERMLSRVAHFLRLTLVEEPRLQVPLAEELALLQAYLDVERIRFGSRLQIVVDVPEALQERPVPPLILQPLVENALKHGLAPRAGGGTLTLAARLEAGHLVLEVRDDGEGLKESITPGIGVANARRRLALLHGDRARLELLPNRPQGAISRITLPA